VVKYFAGGLISIEAGMNQSIAKFPHCWSDVSLAVFGQEASSSVICAAGVGE
jgi:hypothetical protein